MTTSEEALLILRGWQERAVPIFIEASMFGASFRLKGTVSEIRDGGVLLIAEDGMSSLSFSLNDPETCFLYGEPRQFSESHWFSTAPETARCSSALSIAFPLRVRASALHALPSTTEKVFLIELPE